MNQEKAKLSLFEDDIIFSVENPADSINYYNY